MDRFSITICAAAMLAYFVALKRFMSQDSDHDTYRQKILAARFKAAFVCFVPAGAIIWIIAALKP